MAKREEWLQAYQPIRLPGGGHLQTLAGNYWVRQPFEIPFEGEAVVVDEADGSRVLCHCHWRPAEVRADRLTIVLVHGLEGSSDSRYIRGITDIAWRQGCNVIRMNMRNCGGTETWTPTLYHSGLSADVGAVLNHFVRLHGLRRVAMTGYSMGGNLVLKLAGELSAQAPEWLLAAVGVSPAADLAACADAVHVRSNLMYEWHFLRNLRERFRRKLRLFPEIYSDEDLARVRSVREFDDRITARYSGFTGADDYYYRASAARVISEITIPTLVLNSLDDPFIRILPETRDAMKANTAIELVETEHGGHCAFLARNGSSSFDHGRHWAEGTLIRFLLAVAGHADGG